jgi:uncharacterized protein YjbJ (UPF0337 family)
MGWEGKLRNKRDEAEGDVKEYVGMATPDAEMEQESRTEPGVRDLKQTDEKVRDAFGKE